MALAGLGHRRDWRGDVSGAALVSWGCCDKRPQTRWLPTADVYSLMVLEARSPKSRCQRAMLSEKGSGEEPFLALSSIASGGCWKFLATPILGHRSHSRLHCPMACFSVYTPLFIRTPVEGGDPNPG